MTAKLKHVNIGISADSSAYEAKKCFKSICSKQDQVEVSTWVIDLHLCNTKEDILGHKHNVEI